MLSGVFSGKLTSSVLSEYLDANRPDRLQGSAPKRILFVLYDADYEHAPWKGLGPPRVVGVQEFDKLDEYRVIVEGNVSYMDVPLHRIETLVEAKTLYDGDDCEDVSRAPYYSRVFLEACPDRIGFYSLSINKGGWSVHYADSTGITGSPTYRWNSGQFGDLADYVYSLYIPPPRHYARDPTITWDLSLGESRATQKIRVDDEEFPIVRTLITGHMGRKRTTIYIAGRNTREYLAIVKDQYGRLQRGVDEPKILKHIHCQGFVPGVVRLARQDLVEFFDGQPLAFIATVNHGYNACAKHRMVLADMGESLLRAKSINDILMAVYDALEGAFPRCISTHFFD